MLCQVACEKCRREYFSMVVYEKYRENGNTLFQTEDYKPKFLSARDEWFQRDWKEGFVVCHQLPKARWDAQEEETKTTVPIAGNPPPKCGYWLEHVVADGKNE